MRKRIAFMAFRFRESLLPRPLAAIGVLAATLSGPVMALEMGQCCDDFRSTYNAGGALLAGRFLYSDFFAHSADRVTFVTFNYPPPAAFVGALVHSLNYGVAINAYRVFGLAAVAVSIWALGTYLKWQRSSWYAALLIALSGASLWTAVGLANFNVALVAVMLTALVCAARGRGRAAGVLLGVALSVKLLAGPLVVYYAWRRRWDVVVPALLVTSILFAVAAIVAPASTVTFLTRVLPEDGHGSAAVWNMGVPAQLNRLGTALADKIHLSPIELQPVIGVATIVVTGVLLIITFVAVRGRGNELRGGVAVMSLLPLISSVAWDHYALFAMPALLVWAGGTDWLRSSNTRGGAVVAVALGATSPVAVLGIVTSSALHVPALAYLFFALSTLMVVPIWIALIVRPISDEREDLHEEHPPFSRLEPSQVP